MNDNTQLTRRHKGSITAIQVLATSLVLFLLTVSSASAQTATYSDTWHTETWQVVYDPNDDAWEYPESTPPHEITGYGATEADYNDSSEYVQTTLTAPNGTSTSTTSYRDPWYSRAEVGIAYDGDDAEGEWVVNTQHRYWYEEYRNPCYDNPMLDCYIAKAAYSSPAVYGYYVTYYTTSRLRIENAYDHWQYSRGSFFGPFCIYVPGSCIGRCTRYPARLKIKFPFSSCARYEQCRNRLVIEGNNYRCIYGTCLSWGPTGICS